MLRVADFVKCVNQCALLVGFECDVKINGGASRWVAQKLPFDRNGIPGVFDPYVVVIPRYDGRREVGEGHSDKEGENR
jgi:hypothetical protein